MKSIFIAIALVIALPANAELSSFATQDSYSKQMEDMRREIDDMQRRERKRERREKRQNSIPSYRGFLNSNRSFRGFSNSKY